MGGGPAGAVSLNEADRRSAMALIAPDWRRAARLGLAWVMGQRRDEQVYRVNEKVVATVDLPGVPAGTAGKVRVVNGLSWIRYWVFFDNGAELGYVEADQLCTPEQWAERQRRAAGVVVVAS